MIFIFHWMPRAHKITENGLIEINSGTFFQRGGPGTFARYGPLSGGQAPALGC
jgi:hypothetical protein